MLTCVCVCVCVVCVCACVCFKRMIHAGRGMVIEKEEAKSGSPRGEKEKEATRFVERDCCV